MKRIAVILMVGLFLGFGSNVALAKYYISGNLGAGWAEDLGMSDGIDNLEMAFDVGFGATVALGQTYGNGLRAELEGGFFQADLDEVTVAGLGTAPIEGDGTIWYGMFNGYYDFMPKNKVSPFIGLGIGYANAELEVEGVSEDDNVFAYQGALGLAFNINARLNCDVQYRYFGTEEPDFEPGVDADAISIHSVLAGLRYSF